MGARYSPPAIRDAINPVACAYVVNLCNVLNMYARDALYRYSARQSRDFSMLTRIRHDGRIVDKNSCAYDCVTIARVQIVPTTAKMRGLFFTARM